MNSTEDKAREFLSKNIELTCVDLSSISNGVYDTGQLKNCDIFFFELSSSPHLGAGDYVAVPLDGSPPFYLGKIGE